MGKRGHRAACRCKGCQRSPQKTKRPHGMQRTRRPSTSSKSLALCLGLVARLQPSPTYHIRTGSTQYNTHDVTANKNKARKVVERKLLWDSSTVVDVFQLYGEMRAARNLVGRPAALCSKANRWHHLYSSSAPRAPVSASYLQEFLVHAKQQSKVGEGN